MLATVLVVLALACVGLYLARIPIAEYLLAGRLERQGYPDASFTVSQLGWSRAVVTDFVPAPGAALTVDRVTARYSPFDLLSGDARRARIVVGGLALRFDLQDGVPTLAALTGRRAPTRPPGGGPPGNAGAMALLAALPAVEFEDASARIDSDYGAWFVDMDGRLERGENGAPRGDLQGTLRNRRLRVDGRVEGHLDRASLALALEAREDDGFTLDARAHARAPWNDARARVEYEMHMPARADLPWALLPGPAPKSGTVILAGEGGGRWKSDTWSTDPQVLLDRLAAGGWHGRYRIDASDLGFNKRFAAGQVRAAGALAARDGALVVSADASGEASIGQVDEAFWSRFAPPRALVPYVSGPVRLAWKAGDVLRLRPMHQDGTTVLAFSGRPELFLRWPDQPGHARIAATVEGQFGAGRSGTRFGARDLEIEAGDLAAAGTRIARARISGDVEQLPDAAEGRLALLLEAPRVAWAGTTFDGVAVEAPLGVATADGRTRISVAQPGQVQVDGVTGALGVSPGGRLSGTLRAGSLVLDEARDWSLELGFEAFPARVTRIAGRSFAARLGPGRIRAAGRLGARAPLDRIELAGLDVAFPERPVGLQGIDATFRPYGGGVFGEFTIARATHLVGRPRIGPLALGGRIVRAGKGFGLNGRAQTNAGARINLSGHASGGLDAGELRFELPEVRFEPGGLQPADFVPATGIDRDATGHAAAQGVVRWSRAGIDGEATLRVRDLSYRRPTYAVRGLGGTLRLSGLSPLRAAPEQQFRATLLNAGIALTDGRVRFGLVRPPGGGTAVRVVDATARVADGSAVVRDWTWEPGAQTNAFVLRLRDLDVARLFDELGVASLSGRGRLSGALPVTLVDGDPTVVDGTLHSEGGHIDFRSARADQLFADADRGVRLRLQALRNFDYERMDVGIERAPGRETRMNIHLVGHNPDVMDGEKLDFDLVLAGDLEPLVERRVAGGQLDDALLERHLRLVDDED